MYKGEKLSACDICYRDGIASMRQRSVNEYKNDREVLNRVSETLDNNGHSDKTPKRLELKPNNLCNLKCVMCNSYDSSQIAKELKALASTLTPFVVSPSVTTSVFPAVIYKLSPTIR